MCKVLLYPITVSNNNNTASANTGVRLLCQGAQQTNTHTWIYTRIRTNTPEAPLATCAVGLIALSHLTTDSLSTAGAAAPTFPPASREKCMRKCSRRPAK
ncbi:unnamed protein product [Ceratitis capitata]|uniref:(Mediterranean fruit fly) hypothetical protein n=1 Tax=Ceratitis capitata TaxID=7213 RepID=A0A811UGL4_CERCA|nr:unnamed protein product [Ceratitis capitata]